MGGGGGGDCWDCMALEYPAAPEHRSIRARVRSGAYRNVSFVIEPIQLPIVPLSWFSLK